MFSRYSNTLIQRFGGYALLFTVLGVAVIASLWRFWPWMPHVLFGDDLANILQFKRPGFVASWCHLLTDPEGGKYRPIFEMSLYALFDVFGTNLVGYQLINVLLLGLSAGLAFFIAQRLDGGRWALSGIVGLAVATSRFALYQVTQVTGLVEGIALLLFMSMLFCIVRTREGDGTELRWAWLAVLAAFLSINTHERYIVVFPWLFGYFLLSPVFRTKPQSRRIGLLLGTAAAPLLNVLYKVLVLSTPFFLGTGGSLIRPHLSQTVYQIKQAVLSLFGFNYGPEYLVGTDIASIASTSLVTALFAVILATAFASAWVTAGVSGMRAITAKKVGSNYSIERWLTWPLLLACLAVLLLLPPVLTIRVEQRWLLAPYVLLLLIFVCSVSGGGARISKRGWVLAAVVMISSLSIDSIFSAYFPKIFFIRGERFAAAVKRDVVDSYPGMAVAAGFFVRSNTCTWILLKGQFFSIYGNQGRQVYCAQTVQEAESFPPDARIYNFNANGQLVDITESWKGQLRPPGEQLEFDFLSGLSTGHVGVPANTVAADGNGAQRVSWDSTAGLQDTLTITDGYSYRYDSIHVGNGTQLRFAICAAPPGPTTLVGTVSIQEKNSSTPTIVYRGNLAPLRADENPPFVPVSVSLKPYFGKVVSITFDVRSQIGKRSDDRKAGFAWPRIVRVAAP